MPKLILIHAAQTDWQAQGRLAGDTDLPLNEVGRRQAVADSQPIAAFAPTAVHCGPEEATKQTATLIARELGIKAKTLKELGEMDLGHWEGLTVAGFRKRFAKIYKQWRHEPMAIEPPEGEAVSEVAKRLLKGVRRIARKHAGEAIALTLGQFANAILRCELDDSNYEHFWEYIDACDRWHAFDWHDHQADAADAVQEKA